ncbi:stalk domain-containing protein [Paenibacillus doosanensis]|uniref:stalk domain-containing protein n=1 Tax=Paenibacillus doosanensis TaxID=1229154 RepID=UPI00217FC43F|nr:stalk domain-containing protein [Paenibacillus doosanensis]MCS7462008.1 stalk domain-containing protein [Paenibacillus doosanensis]
MLRMLTSSLKTGTLVSAAAAFGLLFPAAAGAVSVAPQHIELFAEKSAVTVNGQQVRLEQPAVIAGDSFYIPLRWLADTRGLELNWDGDANTIRLLTPKAFIEFDLGSRSITVNGEPDDYSSVADIRNDRLLVKLSWIAEYADLQYKLAADGQSAQISFIGTPSSAYKESDLTKDDAQPNSRPIALFAFGKSSYKLGEKVDYVDLSYDPDAEGLPDYEWNGKQDAYYKPGIYPVTLRVKDGKGNESEPFTRSVTIEDEPYLSEAQFPYYYDAPGAVFKANDDVLNAVYGPEESKLPVLVRQPEDKPLVLGSGSRFAAGLGYLYQEKVNGEARLYPQYTNGGRTESQLAVVMRNNNEKAVKVTTTRQAESGPSVYGAVRLGKTAEDFLSSAPREDELVIEPGAAVYYKISPNMAPGQTFQGLYDIRTDGEISVSYAMIAPGDTTYNLSGYPLVASNGAKNGTFPVSEVGWTIDAHSLKWPAAVGMGDPSLEPPLQGYDAMNKQPLENRNHAGVRYRIQLEHTGKMAIALHPRSGFFQGAVRVNGNIITIPAAGLTENEAVLLHRTGGGENSVDIEIMAVDGTQLPVDLVLYPLQAN